MSKRDVLILGVLPPPTGGIASHVRDLTAGLTRRGLDVDVVQPGDGVLGSIAGRAGAGRGWALLAELVPKADKGSLLHAHSILTANPGHRVLGAFSKLVQVRSIRWIETLHDGTLPGRYGRWSQHRQTNYGRLVSRACHVIAVSDELAAFAAAIGVPSSRITTIGPLLPREEQSPPPLPSGYREFIERHEPVLMAVGAWTTSYDFGTIAGAFRNLKERYQNAGLLLVSSSFESDARYRDSVEKSLLPVRADVSACEDIDHGQLLGMMRLADVVIRGPEKESYGLSRVEALMVGTLVVGTRTGVQRFVVPYDFSDVSSLEAAIESAMIDGRPHSQAKAYFEAIAEQNLTEVLSIYETCRAL